MLLVLCVLSVTKRKKLIKLQALNLIVFDNVDYCYNYEDDDINNKTEFFSQEVAKLLEQERNS